MDNAKRIEFNEKVERVRQAPTPDWVKDPRPSDECIAAHDDGQDPHDKSVKPVNTENVQTMVKALCGLRQPDVIYVGGGCFKAPAVFQAEEVNARGVRCYWANWLGINSNDAKEGVVVFIHGGGFVGGHPCVDWCAHFSRIVRKPVLTVTYRKPPEDPLPAATLDVVSVYQWLVDDQHVPSNKIALYGQSAGATLVVLALQEIARRSLALPACGCPVSAWSPQVQGPFMPVMQALMIGNLDGEGQDTRKNADPFHEQYNFLAGKFEGMPPLFVMVGSEEKVYSDIECSIRLKDAAHQAGVRYEFFSVHGMQHCPDEWIPGVPESVEACTRAAMFIHDCFRCGH